MQLFLTYDKSLSLVNTYQAIKVLNVNQDSSQEEIKAAYRKLALEVHPDKNQDKKEDGEFKKITEAYTYLKKNHNQKNNSSYQDTTKTNQKSDFKKKPQITFSSIFNELFRIWWNIR